MKNKEQRPKDRHLDVPAEAERDNHINFLKVEEESAGNIAIDKDSSSKRKKQWQQGLEEGKEARQDTEPVHSGKEKPQSNANNKENDTPGIP